jgi:hypothetical protein
MEKGRERRHQSSSTFLFFSTFFCVIYLTRGKYFSFDIAKKYAHMFFTGLVLCDFVCATLRYGGNDEGGYVTGGNIYFFPDPSFENLIENDIIIRMEREKEEGEIFG